MTKINWYCKKKRTEIECSSSCITWYFGLVLGTAVMGGNLGGGGLGGAGFLLPPEISDVDRDRGTD